MKQKIMFCILLMLLSSVDVALAKGKKKKTKRIQRTETVYYEEIDNFDFLYADGYDTNASFACTDNILSQATSLLGTPYRLGSKGPYTFDCSGFTSYVYRQNNIAIGGSSRDQYARNIPIRREEMQPGDLVFFTSPNSGHGVGHVGIILDYNPVDNTFLFIHASSKNGVKISHSTDGNYSRRYIGVRRVAK